MSLYTAPELVLLFIKTFMTSGGYLIIGTPNAVSLQKRIGMVRGKNPYELIRINNSNPGHFREYTARELRKICINTGYKIIDLGYHHFNSSKGRLKGLKQSLCRSIPQFRDYLSVVCQNWRDNLTSQSVSSSLPLRAYQHGNILESTLSKDIPRTRLIAETRSDLALVYQWERGDENLGT